MVVDLPVPAGPTKTSRWRPEVAICFDGESLIERQPVVLAGQGGLGHGGHDVSRGGRPIEAMTDLEQASFGLQGGRSRVDLMALGPEAAGAIGPAQLLGRGMELGCRDQ